MHTWFASSRTCQYAVQVCGYLSFSPRCQWSWLYVVEFCNEGSNWVSFLPAARSPLYIRGRSASPTPCFYVFWTFKVVRSDASWLGFLMDICEKRATWLELAVGCWIPLQMFTWMSNSIASIWSDVLLHYKRIPCSDHTNLSNWAWSRESPPFGFKNKMNSLPGTLAVQVLHRRSLGFQMLKFLRLCLCFLP